MKLFGPRKFSVMVILKVSPQFGHWYAKFFVCQAISKKVLKATVDIQMYQCPGRSRKEDAMITRMNRSNSPIVMYQSALLASL